MLNVEFRMWEMEIFLIDCLMAGKCFPMKTMQRMMLQRGAAATVTIVVAAFFCEGCYYLKEASFSNAAIYISGLAWE